MGIKFSEKIANWVDQQPPETLYHYTTQSGFLGIIRNKNIWATHSQYLNDEQEYTHARTIAENTLDTRINNASSNLDIKYLQNMKDSLSNTEEVNVCVCSFSQNDDDLSQWRAYSNNKPGFALGFSGESLKKIATDHEFLLGKCIYDLERQGNFIDYMIEESLEELHSGHLGFENEPEYMIDIKTEMGGNFQDRFFKYGLLMKHPSFEQESEWRIITYPLGCTKLGYEFREGISSIIPYYNIKLADSDGVIKLNELTIGPAPHRRQSKNAASNFLMKYGLYNRDDWMYVIGENPERELVEQTFIDNAKEELGLSEIKSVSIKNSSVPYRNW